MKKIGNIVDTICILFGLWFFVSWVDVITHNLTTYTYAWWNFFEIFF